MRKDRHRIESMIDTIRAYGVSDERIFTAMRKIPRHMYVSYEHEDVAYEDSPLPIGHGQTISQPYTVAFMLEEIELRKGQNVLEIGAGSGWNAGLIKQIVGKSGRVTAIEYIEGLAHYARENLRKTYSDVKVIHGDGSVGYAPRLPYDRIIITSACPEIPEQVIEQLTDPGIIIAPVGRLFQQMIKLKKEKDNIHTENLGSFRFVPLRGKHGF